MVHVVPTVCTPFNNFPLLLLRVYLLLCCYVQINVSYGTTSTYHTLVHDIHMYVHTTSYILSTVYVWTVNRVYTSMPDSMCK